MKYFVLARVSDASHHPWVCVAIHDDDYVAAFRESDELGTRPGVETSIVEESALTLAKRNEYRRHLARKATAA